MTGIYCGRCGKAISFFELCYFGDGDEFVCRACRVDLAVSTGGHNSVVNDELNEGNHADIPDKGS